jgi:hypothetical protein
MWGRGFARSLAFFVFGDARRLRLLSEKAGNDDLTQYIKYSNDSKSHIINVVFLYSLSLPASSSHGALFVPDD